MKKQTTRQRLLIVLHNIRERKKSRKKSDGSFRRRKQFDWRPFNAWFEDRQNEGLQAVISKRYVEIILPKEMNFSTDFEMTALHLNAIRKLSTVPRASKAYRLSLVNFDQVRGISSSAALVLTAELSRWEDSIRKRLMPRTGGWDKKILNRLNDLGFFEIFGCAPYQSTDAHPDISFLKYIKGRKRSNAHAQLKSRINDIAKVHVDKWTFLRSGLNEAVTNVGHHAYPPGCDILIRDQNWYLSGAYNRSSGSLKIVFYDQGIGIPRSLPASKIKEVVLRWFSDKNIPNTERWSDANLLTAAMEARRTRTSQSDRGKGLQDLLDFVKKRGEGYLSVLSRKGLYKFTMKKGRKTPETKTVSFDQPINGTLIIWKVFLERAIYEDT